MKYTHMYKLKPCTCGCTRTERLIESFITNDGDLEFADVDVCLECRKPIEWEGEEYDDDDLPF